MERTITLQHGNIPLAASIHYPIVESKDANGKLPLVVICHGFVGSRLGVDRLFVEAGRELAARGSIVIRFDYAGCGESGGQYGEHGLDSMISQTRTVLDYGLGLDCVDPLRFTLLGHSLGGAAALLTAGQDRRVKSLALWSPAVHPFHDIKRIVGRSVYEEAVSTGCADYLGYKLTAGFFESLQNHQPLPEAHKFHGDVFLAHGTGDDDIPADYTFLLEKTFWQRGEGRCDKSILLHADHTFSGGGHRTELFRATGDWIAEQEERQRGWHHWSI